MSQQPSERNEAAGHDSAAADANDKVTSLFGARQEPETGPVDEALELFNQMSRQITDSYRTLEERVNDLAGRLSSEERRRRRTGEHERVQRVIAEEQVRTPQQPRGLVRSLP